MDFEWDEAKAPANLEKHGIDFRDAKQIFLAPILETRSDRGGEARWKAIGELGETLIAVVDTCRSGRCRLISARRADGNERTTYREVVYQRR